MPTYKIIEIDMHGRDRRVQAWISDRIHQDGGVSKITYMEIAKEFECCYVTARNIVGRLKKAGCLIGEKKSNTLGYEYQLPEVAA